MDTELERLLGWVRFCPVCGHSLEEAHSLLNVYSEADAHVCVWWCHACGSKGEVTPLDRFTAPELAES